MVPRGFSLLLTLGLGLVIASAPARGHEPLTAAQYRADFDAMVAAVGTGYAYLASRAEWRRSAAAWREKAAAARSRPAFAAVLEEALAPLRDDHVAISGEGFSPARRVPAETDVWAEWVAGKPLITAVRPSSVADVAGLHPGQEIVSVHGVAVERVVRGKVGGTAGKAARDWALRHVMAGPRAGPYYLGVREDGPARVYEVVRAPEGNGNGAPLLARKVGEERDLAYIRLRNNLGDPGLVMHFDAALQQMKDTRGLILDLRSTEGGGTDEVVRALIGRFIDRESAWQLRERPGHARETDRVAPRGPFAYKAPLVVLVDRWTAAEGEALAAGLDAAADALLIGTRMAGLRGVRRDVTLANTGLTVSFPGERAFHPNGKPREALVPDVEIDLAKPSGGPGDPVLYQGLKTLEARKGK